VLIDYFSVGYILKPQGIKGELRVKPLTDSVDRFNDFDTVLLRESDGSFSPLSIINTRYMKNWVILMFAGYDTRDKAESIRGRSLWIHRSMAKKLPSDAYYIADIVGCSVYTEKGDALGRITNVITTGSNDVYVVDDGEREMLIPALKKIVVNIDIVKRRIIVDPNGIEGLVYDED